MRRFISVALVLLVCSSFRPVLGWGVTYRIDHVTDGDTVVLRNGWKVRLVQIHTPEVFFGTECYGPAGLCHGEAAAFRRRPHAIAV